MNDLTVIYYTCNKIEEPFGTNIRNHLLSILPEEVQLISVSQKPMNFGKNIYMSGLEPSIYNVYRQILTGAKETTTKYISCVEDDALYVREHFEHRPEDDSFDYNSNRWHINESFYFWRPRAGMHTCISPTALMISTLEKRFAKYPAALDNMRGFCEPGRREYMIGLPKIKFTMFSTTNPVLVFNHRLSLGGKRKVTETDRLEVSLPCWGSADSLWKRMWGLE